MWPGYGLTVLQPAAMPMVHHTIQASKLQCVNSYMPTVRRENQGHIDAQGIGVLSCLPNVFSGQLGCRLFPSLVGHQ